LVGDRLLPLGAEWDEDFDRRADGMMCGIEVMLIGTDGL
jgi:hypothetical protein